MKKTILVTLTIALVSALALAFTACKDEPSDDEKTQNSPNTPMFADKTATITTTDTFTDKQWNAIVTAIVGKFSTGYDTPQENPADPAAKKTAYETAFNNLSITIIVEKVPNGYTNYKYIKNGKTLYVRADGVNNINTDTIVLAIINAQDNIDGVTQP